MKFLKSSLSALVCSLILSMSGVDLGASTLSLDDAVARTAAVHPDLRGFANRARLLGLEGQRAALIPPLSVGIDLENALGSGDYSGVSSAETTLSLAGVMERGGKRAAREALIATRMDELAVERQAKELDVLAEVARRYLDLAEAQARLPLVAASVERQRALAKAVRKRFEEGASPEALAFSAEAEVARREAGLAAAERGIDVAWRALALMWRDASPGAAPGVPARSAALPALQPIEALLESLRQSPDVRYFAQVERVQEARRRIASTARSPDLSWQLGVRRLESSNDIALVAGVSLPLGMRSRAALDESVEEVNLGLVRESRDATVMELEATLVRAHGALAAALVSLRSLEQDILPRLAVSSSQAQRAYAAGALSYFESMQLQNEVSLVELEMLALRFDIDRKLVELQRLTGDPIVISPARKSENK